MAHHMMIGCDLHARSLVLAIALDNGPVTSATYTNTRAGRDSLYEAIAKNAARYGHPSVSFVYEACGLGYSLYDELIGRGVQCHVVAPTKLPTSVKQRRDKTDAKDALRLLELLRGHLLAGNSLPTAWVPPPEVRDDRELTRQRGGLGDKMSTVKCEIRSLLKRGPFELAAWSQNVWSAGFEERLWDLTAEDSCLGPGARATLASLLRQKKALAAETRTLDKALKQLACDERHRARVEALRKLGGVGLLTAMVFLAELGDLLRFGNRRQLAAYLGLAPSSHESGERSDCKGHITHQGPGRLRKVLNQAVWTQVRRIDAVGDEYRRQTYKQTGRKKKVVTALMRKLAVVMWHRAREVSDPNPSAGTRRATIFDRVTARAERPPAKDRKTSSPPAPPTGVRSAAGGAGKTRKENNRR